MPRKPASKRIYRPHLRAAVHADHPCEDYGCDIRTALDHNHVEVAAFLLEGATEAPEVTAVVSKYGLNLTALGGMHSAAFDKWKRFHDANGRQCPACESFMYADPVELFEPETCTNCLAELRTETSA
jgi:hypothetical protein